MWIAFNVPLSGSSNNSNNKGSNMYCKYDIYVCIMDNIKDLKAV